MTMTSPGMTTGEPFQTHWDALKHAVFRYGFDHIL